MKVLVELLDQPTTIVHCLAAAVVVEAVEIILIAVLVVVVLVKVDHVLLGLFVNQVDLVDQNIQLGKYVQDDVTGPSVRVDGALEVGLDLETRLKGNSNEYGVGERVSVDSLAELFAQRVVIGE